MVKLQYVHGCDRERSDRSAHWQIGPLADDFKLRCMNIAFSEPPAPHYQIQSFGFERYHPVVTAFLINPPKHDRDSHVVGAERTVG